MADEWSTLLVPVSWGGVECHVLSTRVDLNRAIAVAKYPYRDGADTDDMGAEPREFPAKLVFFATPTAPRPYELLRKFVELVESGKPYTFVHPYLGSFVARVTTCSIDTDADARAQYEVDCTFLEHSTVRAMLVQGDASLPTGSLEEVELLGAELDAALAAASPATGLALVSDMAAAAIAKVTSWIEEPPALQKLALELATLQSGIQTEIDRLKCATDIKRWSIYQALLGLSFALRRFADGSVRVAPKLIEIILDAPVPLIVFAADLYGAGEAIERAEQLRTLNTIPNPARIEAGTVLVCEQPPRPQGR